MKAIKIVTLSLLVLVVVLGGGFYVTQKAEQDYMLEVVQSDEVKQIIEEDIVQMNNGRDLITNYTIMKDSVEKSPMGGLKFKIYVNDDKELYILYSIDKDLTTGRLRHTGGGNSQKLELLIKKD